MTRYVYIFSFFSHTIVYFNKAYEISSNAQISSNNAVELLPKRLKLLRAFLTERNRSHGLSVYLLFSNYLSILKGGYWIAQVAVLFTLQSPRGNNGQSYSTPEHCFKWAAGKENDSDFFRKMLCRRMCVYVHMYLFICRFIRISHKIRILDNQMFSFHTIAIIMIRNSSIKTWSENV